MRSSYTETAIRKIMPPFSRVPVAIFSTIGRRFSSFYAPCRPFSMAGISIRPVQSVSMANPAGG